MTTNEVRAIKILQAEYKGKSLTVSKTLKRWLESGIPKNDDSYRYLEVKQEVYDGVVSRCDEILKAIG